MTDTNLKPKGRLSPLLIDDFLTGKFELAQHDGDEQSNPIFRLCRELCNPPRNNHPRSHEFLVIGSQCYDGPNDPEEKGCTLLSAFCGHCRYHFAFRIYPGRCNEARTDFPLHHYVIKKVESFETPSADDPEFGRYKLYPLVSRAELECSVCQQKVLIDVTAPRLKSEWFDLLLDTERIRKQAKLGQESDPQRFANLDVQKMSKTALNTLNAYLRDLLKPQDGGPARKISFRNKTFFVQFGPDCDHIFRYLGFREFHDTKDDEQKWVLPEIEAPAAITPLASSRAFIEDARSEVQSVMNENKSKTDELIEFLAKPGLGLLEKALGCEQHRRRGRVGDDLHGEERRILGLFNNDSSLFKYAYERQKAADHKNRKGYRDALKQIVVRANLNDLMVFVAEEESVEDVPQLLSKQGETPLEAALRHFGLDASNDAYDEGSLIGLYRNYRSQSSKSQAIEHRKAFFRIAQASKNQDMIMLSLADMDITEACAFLEVEDGWPLDMIWEVARTRKDEFISITVQALNAVAKERTQDEGYELFKKKIDQLAAAIENSNGSVSSFEDIASSSKVTASSASCSNSPQDASNSSINSDLPVGLGNLRNTCYLNSILQYFYSVKDVRDLVLKSHPASLPPSQHSVVELLSSGGKLSELDPGRAFVGSEFASELKKLFQELQSTDDASVTPRQRLANAALLRTDVLRAVTAEAVPKEAPPLPPRDTKSLPSGESHGPKVTVDAVPDTVETASNMSSQTLVDQPIDDTTYVVVDHATAKASGTSESPDTEMKDFTADTHDDDDELKRDSAIAVNVKVAKDESPAVESKVSEASASRAKEGKLSVEELALELDQPNVGSDQMDVDEVMGNAIDHLRAAFKVSTIGQSSEGSDPIEAAFFSTFVDNRKRPTDSAWNRTKRKDRWVTAYPAGRESNVSLPLHDALEASFDRDVLGGSNIMTFTSILDVAPHFHVYIQRSDGGGKNSNSIVIPETLYLDRYMDAESETSEIYRLRKRAWDIKARMSEIESDARFVKPPKDNQAKSVIVVAQSDSAEPSQEELSSYMPLIATDRESHSLTRDPELDVDSIRQRYPSLKRSSDGDMHGRAKSPKTAVHDVPGQAIGSGSKAKAVDMSDSASADYKPPRYGKALERNITEQWKLLNAERATIFDNLKQVKYRLHAVICHLGTSATAGHYWVWIHDFEKNVWRRYNDTTVTECNETQFFQDLKGSEPYYLAYVRDQGLHDLVIIPPRKRAASHVAEAKDEPCEEPGALDQVAEGDIEMADMNASSEHIEDVEMKNGAA